MFELLPIVETSSNDNLRNFGNPDADDPAIYYNQRNPAKSIVIGTQKNAGLSVYNLNGDEIQRIKLSGARYNNVDIIYDFSLGSKEIDIAIASDRNNDSLAIFKIDPGRQRIRNFTSQELRNADASIFGIDNRINAAYGLAAYTSVVDGKSYVFVTENQGDRIAQLELIDDGSNRVNASVVRTLNLPGDAGQAEGLVIDRENGTLYVAQEDFGIYKVDAEVNGSNEFSVVDSISNGSGTLQSDVEGLTIDYANNYLIASSQGNDTFVVYDRQGNNELIDTFSVVDGNGIDGVQRTDGIDVSNQNFGDDFAEGLLVVHDGQNENGTTNFKYLSLEDLSNGGSSGGGASETVQIRFQAGNNGYNGTVDTFVQGAFPDEDNSGSTSLNIDGDDDNFEVQGLLRFEDIIGENNQIPEDAEIVSARLELNVSGRGSSLQFHRMATDWSDADTWNTLEDGIQANGTEAIASPDAVTGTVPLGLLSVDVTDSVRAWQEDPASNYGWAILPTGTNGVDFDSAEGSNPPNLIVEYTLDNSNDAVLATESSDI